MASNTAARRYAKGLLQYALEHRILAEVLTDMQFVADTFFTSPELKRVLSSPVINDSRKKSVIDEVFAGVKADVVRNLFNLLSEKRRFDLLADVARVFVELYKAHVGILDITITTAFDLNQSQIDNVVSVLSKTTGKKIVATVTKDPSLLGGISVQYHDTVIDGSVRNKLQRMTDLMHV